MRKKIEKATLENKTIKSKRQQKKWKRKRFGKYTEKQASVIALKGQKASFKQ